MARSPSIKEINSAMSRSIRSFCKKLSHLRPELAFRSDGRGKFVSRINGVSVIVHGKVIRASNGEVAGWPIANVISGETESVFYNPPWLEGGCSPSAVIAAYDHHRKGA